LRFAAFFWRFLMNHLLLSVFQHRSSPYLPHVPPQEFPSVFPLLDNRVRSIKFDNSCHFSSLFRTLPANYSSLPFSHTNLPTVSQVTRNWAITMYTNFVSKTAAEFRHISHVRTRNCELQASSSSPFTLGSHRTFNSFTEKRAERTNSISPFPLPTISETKNARST
jgi:hypothetical protein